MNQTNQKPTWSRNNATILSTMQFLTSRDLLSCTDEPDNYSTTPERESALTYLQDRLQLTRMQVRILTAILYYSAQHSGGRCDMDDLSDLLCMHPLRLLQLGAEFDFLDEMGYLTTGKAADGEMSWHFSSEAKDALVQDKAFEIISIRLEDNFTFLHKSRQILSDGRPGDEDGTIAKRINRLMKQNPQLSVVQNLQQIKSVEDRWCMLQFMTTLGIDNDRYANFGDIDDMLSARTARNLLRQMRNGSHPFVQNGYIEPYCEDGQTQIDQWVITLQGWTTMLGNLKEAEEMMPQQRNDDNTKLLTPYDKLTEHPLYFSGKTEDQVNTLSHLLQEEQFANIRQALKKRGMPTGFCCLFYGTPGTGKTELVQQLAIATKRDLLQVNLSTLRDKYVGESEKQVKRIFDQYRSLVRSQERAPILFFNEADAILGNRMENTQRAVDKMENAIQNIILQEMEQLEGIMICTTNLTSCLDKAFDRRFIYKIEFEKPTSQARKQIWKSMLNDLNDEQAAELASRYDFSGGQIQNISRKQVINAIFSGKDKLDYEQIKQDCLNESISRNSRGKVGF